MVQRFTAFQASEELQALNEQFQRDVSNPDVTPDVSTLIKIMQSSIDEMLHVYFLKPVTALGEESTGFAIVKSGVAVIKKTGHLAISQAFKNASDKDVIALAAYMDNVVIDLPTEDGATARHVAIPLSDQLYIDLLATIEKGRASSPSDVKKEFAAHLGQMVHEAVYEVVERPFGLIKLGFVMEKVTKLAIDTGRGAAHGIVTRLPGAMSEPDLHKFFDFIESLLMERDS